MLRDAMPSGVHRNGDDAVSGADGCGAVDRAIGTGVCAICAFQQGE